MRTAPAPSLVLDVFPATPADLRQQARERAFKAQLPGGLVVEEAADGVSYHLEVAGNWRATQDGADWHFSHPNGQELVLGSNGFTLRLPE